MCISCIREMWQTLDVATLDVPYPAPPRIYREIEGLLTKVPPALREAVRASYWQNSRDYWRDLLARDRCAAIRAVDLTHSEPASMKFATDFAQAVIMREQTRRECGSLPPPPPVKGYDYIFNN